MTLQEKLGKAVVKLRKRLGVSQEQFAFDSNIDRKYMSDIENGKRNVSVDVLERLAKSLHISISQLFVEVDNIEYDREDNFEIKDILCEQGHEDATLFENPDFASAIIGISEEGRVIYSYSLMINHLVDKERMSEDDAVEFIDYNTIRTLPYMGEKSPIIMYSMEV